MNEKNRNCEKVNRLLQRYMDGELPPRDHEWVKAELASCDTCRKELDQLQKLRALVREVYIHETEHADLSALLPAVMDRIHREPATLWRRLLNLFDRYRIGLASPAAPIGVAATVAVATIAFALVYVSTREPDTSPRSGPVVAGQMPQPETPALASDSPPAGPPPSLADARDGGARRPMHEEKAFKRNEFFVTYYKVDSGTVVIDVDPEGDEPAVVWHFADDSPPADREDNRI